MRYDENGWYAGLGEPLAPELAYTVFSPEPSSRLDIGDLDRELGRIAKASARLVVPKRYPHGMSPTIDAAEIEITGDDLETTTLGWWTFPVGRTAGLLRAARTAGHAGGGGMDALLVRTKRVQQVEAAPHAGTSPRAVLLLAAAISQRCLGPVLPPGQERLLGPSSLRSLVARALGPE